MKSKYEEYIKTHKFHFDELQAKLCDILDEYLIPKGLFQKYSHSGVYIYGGVGTGKTTIMDLFFSNTQIKQKKRIHLSALLREIEENIEVAKKLKYKDPMEYIFKQYSKLKLFCIDEFEIHDIVSSILIRRLMIYLINKGCIFIITSNTIPENLYKDGLQREKFLELILNIRTKMQSFCLDKNIDYRKIDKEYIKKHKIIQISNQIEADEILKKLVSMILDEKFDLNTKELNVNNREVIIEYQNTLAIIDFEKFCKGNYGSHDYQTICKNFGKILIYNIKKPNIFDLDVYRRFCALIDAIYDQGVQMYGIIDFDYQNFDITDLTRKIPQITRCFSRLFELG